MGVNPPMSEATPPDAGKEMETVTSADGTEIAYKQTGSGSPLVLVHGAVSDHRFWDAGELSSLLVEHFTVYAMDRRGHGESDDGPYEIERIFEDVLAVTEAIDDPVTLLGISSGGLYALEAARRTDDVQGLILYEPAVAVGEDEEVEQAFMEVMALLDDGKEEEALVSFLEEVAHVSPEELDLLRSDSYWQELVKFAHTIPMEIPAVSEYEFDPDQFVRMTTPTLLVGGSESDEQYREGIELLDDALPNSRIATIDGGHLGVATSPEQFTNELLGFVRGSN